MVGENKYKACLPIFRTEKTAGILHRKTNDRSALSYAKEYDKQEKKLKKWEKVNQTMPLQGLVVK